MQPTVLIIGTADTKSDEIRYLRTVIERDGARSLIMDVGVLGEPAFTPDISRHEIAAAAGTSNAEIIALGDENRAMTRTAEGARTLTLQLLSDGQIDGVVALGGTMGTDLALDVMTALPLGVPKLVISTVAFSPLLPPERIPPDVMMILWSGGLYGLNSICRSALSQAAGAVVGACRHVEPPQQSKPVIGMTSLGKTSLQYMVQLKPELERRGYEVAVFHTTGMGGRAMESLAAAGRFAAVLDFSLVEVSNHQNGSVVSAGANRLEGAGLAGVPQIVAPGGVTLIDMQTWGEPAERFSGREVHEHNRLIACVIMSDDERAAAGRLIAEKLNRARGAVAFVMPLGGIDEWDRSGGPFHNPAGLTAFTGAVRDHLDDSIEWIELDAHINDPAFSETVLKLIDRWVDEGTILPGVR